MDKKQRDHEASPRSIKYHVKKYLTAHRDRVAGKQVVDFPAGNGTTSRLVEELGGTAVPLDLFPEYFEVDGLHCERANINEGLPLDDGQADMLICQEGIEHFSDQMGSMKEFNRVMKNGGRLIITTPNYSNLRSRFSYLLSESERLNHIMPPNELDSIWMSDSRITKEIYYGHIFLIGIMKLRCMAALAGFKLRHVQPTVRKNSSVFLMFIFYPFIVLSNWITYRRRMKRNSDFSEEVKKEVYGEIYRLSIDTTILTDGHLFVEFEKVEELDEVAPKLRSAHAGFGLT